jgi:hypothetical protein
LGKNWILLIIPIYAKVSLNLDSVSRIRTERLRLFDSLTVAETKESLVKDSLQNGTIISVWDNCGVSNSCKLERLQLEAAIIITGLPIFTNTEYIYRETGWERLEERRTRRKLQLLYNIQNGSIICNTAYPRSSYS